MDIPESRLFVAGQWVAGIDTEVVTDKFSGEPLATLHVPDRAQISHATAFLADGVERSVFAPYDRFRVLSRASALLVERRELFMRTIVAEAGFAISDAGGEVDRAVETLLLSAEEAKRIRGEMVPLDAAPGGSHRIGFTMRFPLGVVCAITPFNSPLNTVVHKVAPAIAAGNAVVLKPSVLTPLTAQRLVELLLDAGLPTHLVALVHGAGATVGQWLLEDPVPQFYAFTGSTDVGAIIRRTVGLRRSQLEMGSISSTIVCDDADLERCVELCVKAAFRKAGQVCTSIQRLHVQRAVAPAVRELLTAALVGRRAGNPRDPASFIGPLISESEALRVEAWVAEAVCAGAEVIAGGSRTGSLMEPTVLANVGPRMAVNCREVFGPVVSLSTFDDLDEAIMLANSTPYGLAAGMFTTNIARALYACRNLHMGCVHVNETSSSRVDLMPYGGVKHSGLGREGPRYAVDEMTEERMITLGA